MTETRIQNEITNYMGDTLTIKDTYHLILEKKSGLSKRCRDYIIKYFKN